MRTSLLTLDENDILEILKEKYPNASHIELYVDEGEEVDDNNPIIAEVNLPEDETNSRTQTDNEETAEISAIFAAVDSLDSSKDK